MGQVGEQTALEMKPCDHALTGSLSEGKEYLISIYNELLQAMVTQNKIPRSSSLSHPLDSGANIGELGCAASLVLALLKN